MASALVGGVLAVGVPASAVAIYTYTGNAFDTLENIVGPGYTTSMKVTATMTLDAPLGPGLHDVSVLSDLVSLTLFDGMDRPLDLTNPWLCDGILGPCDGRTTVTATFSTDDLGNIIGWQLRIQVSRSIENFIARTVETLNVGGGTVRDRGHYFEEPMFPGSGASVSNAAGTWSLVPEPTTLTLVTLGLVAMARVARRKAC